MPVKVDPKACLPSLATGWDEAPGFRLATLQRNLQRRIVEWSRAANLGLHLAFNPSGGASLSQSRGRALPMTARAPVEAARIMLCCLLGLPRTDPRTNGERVSYRWRTNPRRS